MTSKPLRRFARVCLVASALCAMVASSPSAHAGSVTGALLNAPGERSHNAAGGWPEVFYVWEGVSMRRFALGPRVAIQLWPFALHVGLHARVKLAERGKAAIALLLNPSFNLAGFGGTRATYSNNYGFGRSRAFRPSLGPGLNIGLLATIDLSPVVHLNLTYENPLALWVWTSPVSWWIEWPVTVTGGVEYDISYHVSIFGRVGGGPSIAFSGSSQLIGGHWHLHIGAQFRY